MITVDLYADPICPWCFIGKRRLERALATRPDIESRITWHAFQLNPTMPNEGMDRVEYISMKFGNPENARRLYDNIRAVGEQAGIPFAFEDIARTPNTLNAHRLIQFASDAPGQEQIVERLFCSYFLDGIDIGSVDALIEIAVDCGFPRKKVSAYLESGQNADIVRNEDMQARQAGIRGVPFYILNQQYAISGAQEPEAFHPLFDLLIARDSEMAERASA